MDHINPALAALCLSKLSCVCTVVQCSHPKQFQRSINSANISTNSIFAFLKVVFPRAIE